MYFCNILLFTIFLLYIGVYFSFITHIALLKFDTYINEIRACIEINAFTVMCLQQGILEYQPFTSTSADDEKKNIVLESIRKNIIQRGTLVFLNMIKVLENLEHSRKLAITLRGMVIVKVIHIYIH